MRAAARWVAWAWSPTQLWTDSALVVRGVRRVPDGGHHGMTAQKDIWNRIELGLRAKGLENFQVRKVKGHAKDKGEDEQEEARYEAVE